MNKIWFTSDTHAYHTNIAGEKVSQWDSGYRTFNDEFEMTDHIVEQINKYVGENDTLYHLGDFSFAGIDNIWKFRKQLKCKNIHLVLGNHDHHLSKNKQIKILREERDFYNSFGFIESANNYNSGIVRCQDLFASVSKSLEIETKKYCFFMSHYPHLSWLGSSKGYIMLHGHEHGGINHLNENCRRMDVGIDSAYIMFGEYRPFSLEEVLAINLTKPISELGHHTKNTNVQ